MVMASSTTARLFVAGTSDGGRPRLARVDIGGAELRVRVREYVDPMIRSGRGGNSGAIAALGSAVDVAGGVWLLVSVERGRPRLVDPDRLGVVALLGRRREWRGAADERSPFLPVVCDRAPVEVDDRSFVLTRAPRGGVDLVAVRPGEPIERWSVGEHSGRVELLAGHGTLGFWAHGRVAIVELAELVPGGCPLLDPRDVELPLRWLALPNSVVAVCDLVGEAVRVIERHDERWTIAELQIEGDRLMRRASWTIARPERWLASGGSLWLAGDGVWTRVEAGQGLRERSEALGSAMSPAALERDAAGHPWLWIAEQAELLRVDGVTLESVERWAIPAELHGQRLLVLPPGAAPEPCTIVHADELAELLALEPELADAWRGWFNR